RCTAPIIPQEGGGCTGGTGCTASPSWGAPEASGGLLASALFTGGPGAAWRWDTVRTGACTGGEKWAGQENPLQRPPLFRQSPGPKSAGPAPGAAPSDRPGAAGRRPLERGW